MDAKRYALLLLACMVLFFPAAGFSKDTVEAYDPIEKSGKTYSLEARKYYSENDVKAFVYKWFAGFDHQKNPEYFTSHLDPDRVDMAFPDFPINSIKDFLRWYQGVVDTIQWNSHSLSGLTVAGSENSGFSVSLDVRWQARAYDGQSYDMTVHQTWQVAVGPGRQFIITRHRATVL